MDTTIGSIRALVNCQHKIEKGIQIKPYFLHLQTPITIQHSGDKVKTYFQMYLDSNGIQIK